MAVIQDSPFLMRQFLQIQAPIDSVQNGLTPLATPFKVPVVSGSGATLTLTKAQSGSVVLLDRAAGIVVTLPPPEPGLSFTFAATVSVTSNVYKIITDAGTTFVSGLITEATASGASNIYNGNGTTHISIAMNGTTTGGLLGSFFEFYAVSSTLWVINGSNLASGTIAGPFSTT